MYTRDNTGLLAYENVTQEANGARVPCGIARSVLAVYVMDPPGEIPGQIFRVQDPTTGNWLFPPEFSIDVFHTITEKDLVRSAEDVAEALVSAVRDQEDEILLYLLEQAKSIQNATTREMTWPNLSALAGRAQQLIANFDFMANMDAETMQHFEPTTRLSIAESGCIGRININEPMDSDVRMIPVWQRIVPDAAHWIAACPSPADLGAIALYNTEATMDGDRTVHQKCKRCMVVFGVDVQFLGE